MHDPRPKPTPTIAELPRIEGRTEPPAAEPELSFRARVEPHGGGAEVVARARTRIGVIAVSCVLIVFFIVAGVVLVARNGAASARIRGAPAGAPSTPSASSAPS